MKPDWSTADGGSIRLYCADALSVLPTLDECSIDSIVTDPPYGLEFMGKEWDKLSGQPGYVERGRITDRPESQVPFGRGGGVNSYQAGRPMQEWHHAWAIEALRVLKPGGHLLAFGGSRTYHRLASAIEDAGFEIRDCIMWIYGSGFPKSLDVSKAIDKAAGLERDKIPASGGLHKNVNLNDDGWRKIGSAAPVMDSRRAICAAAAAAFNGWGTALKPAHEPIVVARKPLSGTVAANVLQHGTGGLNIDGCRIEAAGGDYLHPGNTDEFSDTSKVYGWAKSQGKFKQSPPSDLGRWPANVIHDGSEEATAGFPESDGQQGYVGPEHGDRPSVNGIYGDFGARPPCPPRIDTGSAARFFYCAKADASERRNSKHPTVKPLALMQYLVRLVTPPNGTVLDLFMGSGTTIEAAFRGNFKAIGIEREAAYFPDCIARLEANRAPLFDPVPFEPAPKIIQGSLLDTEAQP